jgi:two-component system, NarL family, nitrate/nitrite response regulator NarL
MALRVLIVDDSTHFLRAARTLLEREGVHVVAEASTGAEAIEHACSLRPDVTLIDVDLGDENGFDLARRLASEATGAIAGRLVLISAYPETDLRELIDASPVVGFLPKSQLSGHAIRQLLGDGRTGPTAT